MLVSVITIKMTIVVTTIMTTVIRIASARRSTASTPRASRTSTSTSPCCRRPCSSGSRRARRPAARPRPRSPWALDPERREPRDRRRKALKPQEPAPRGDPCWRPPNTQRNSFKPKRRPPWTLNPKRPLDPEPFKRKQRQLAGEEGSQGEGCPTLPFSEIRIRSDPRLGRDLNPLLGSVQSPN